MSKGAVAIVIPARFASTRFPGKLLVSETGKPLIQHTWECARLARCANRVLIAADDDRILDAAASFGAESILTRSDHPNGSSRLAEVAQHLHDSIIVNVQGDEPEIEPELIDAAVASLMADPGAVVATIASPFAATDDPANPNIVKVAVAANHRALYFSRSIIPFNRDAAHAVVPLRHVGLYAYRRDFLMQYPRLNATPLEQAESLEQLRILEHGHAIAVAVRPSSAAGIDTPEQYAEFVRRMKSTRPAAKTP